MKRQRSIYRMRQILFSFNASVYTRASAFQVPWTKGPKGLSHTAAAGFMNRLLFAIIAPLVAISGLFIRESR